MIAQTEPDVNPSLTEPFDVEAHIENTFQAIAEEGLDKQRSRLADDWLLVGFQITERGSRDDTYDIAPPPPGYLLFTPNLTRSHRLTLFIKKESFPALREGEKYLVADVSGQRFEVESAACGLSCRCAARVTGVGPIPHARHD